MKRLMMWLASSILMLGLLVTGVRSVGASLKLSRPTFADLLADNSQLGPHGWCWRDICPGETLLEDAEASLRTDKTGLIDKVYPLSNGFCCVWSTRTGPRWEGSISDWQGLRNNELKSITSEVSIDPPDELFRLGDAIRLFGEPESVFLCAPYTLPGKPPIVAGGIFFNNGVSVSVYSFVSEVRTDPEMVVNRISYFGEHNPNPNLPSDPWYRFTAHPSHACGV